MRSEPGMFDIPTFDDFLSCLRCGFVWIGSLLAAGCITQLAEAAPPGSPQTASLLSILAAGEVDDACFPPLVGGAGRYRGSRTCQSAACHGSLEPKAGGKVRRNEFTIWRDKDPHAKAYANISVDNKRSREMLERLGIAKDKKIVDQAGYDNCQKCHNLGVSLKSPEGTDLVDGVSCEACHGPAEKWYSDHFKIGFDPKKSASLGIVNTEDVFVRARLCVQCHVGAADRDVNHDLLAAGHPQLKFEMAAYLHLVPKHWNDAGERKAAGNELFELQLWAAGQIAAADASLAVLEARASRATKSTGAVWPEFAETDCFACHHDLSYPSWRQQRGFASRTPGNLPWGSWYFGLIDRLAEKDGGAPSAAQFQKSLAALKKTMEARISPDPEVVASQARAAREALCKWAKADGALVAATAKPARLREVFATFSAAKDPSGVAGEGAVENWDVATQLYLAVTAVHEANKDENKKQGRPESLDDKVVADWIKQLRVDLAFTAGYDSPREFAGLAEKAGTKTSPREKVRSTLLQVFQQLDRRGDK